MKRTLFRKEHDLYREAFNAFLDREVVPFQEQWEKDREVGTEVWRKAGEYGFLCPWADEKYGGAGADFLYSVVTIEAMGYGRLHAPNFHLHDRIVVPLFPNCFL